ncbi:uncharacterized protein LOC117106650 isoform X2 [Anneissia japonica]|uniref:uncharacterized protein LOC117106650 isoform X2 n=1 Tax=Anneissia japonica TaxID=1529436 RepID=UPI0014256875|nr:uncharacterized protein LOC117106650 isoform X2 [Anneissia japonica]
MELIHFTYLLVIARTRNLFFADKIEEILPFPVEVDDGGDAELAIGAGGGNVAGFFGAGGGAGGFGGRRNGNGGRRNDNERPYQYIIMYLILLYLCLILIYIWCYLWVLFLVHAGIIPDNQLLEVMATNHDQAWFMLTILMFILPFYWMR